MRLLVATIVLIEAYLAVACRAPSNNAPPRGGGRMDEGDATRGQGGADTTNINAPVWSIPRESDSGNSRRPIPPANDNERFNEQLDQLEKQELNTPPPPPPAPNPPITGVGNGGTTGSGIGNGGSSEGSGTFGSGTGGISGTGTGSGTGIGGGQCRVRSNNEKAYISLGAFSLAPSAASSRTPFTLDVTVRHGADKQRSAHCIGLANAIEAIARGRDWDKSLYFPRLYLAKHCLASDRSDPIREISFRDVDGDKEITYSLDDNGYLTDAAGRKVWYLNPKSLQNTNVNDPCSLRVRDAAKSSDEAKISPCFNLRQDRITLITAMERDMLEAGLKRSDNKTPIADVDDYDTLILSNLYLLQLPDAAADTIRHNIIEFYGGASGSKTLAWDEVFLRANLRGTRDVDLWRLSGYAELVKANKPSTADQALGLLYQALDANLKELYFTSLFRSGKSTPDSVLAKKDGSWRDLLLIDMGKSLDGSWRIESFGLSAKAVQSLRLPGDTNQPFRKGDSGTVVIADFETIGEPMVSIMRQRRLFGVLSTVGGQLVCEGDDLLCCDRK